MVSEKISSEKISSEKISILDNAVSTPTGCTTKVSNLPDTVEVWGFSSMQDTNYFINNKCYNATYSQDTAGYAKASFGSVYSSKQLSSALSISGSGGFKTLEISIEGGLAYKSANQDDALSYSFNMLYHYMYPRIKYEYGFFVLSETGKNFCEYTSSNFLQYCGDKVLSYETRHAYLVATLKFVAESTESKTKIAGHAEASFAGGLLNIQGSIDHLSKQATTDWSLAISVTQAGGNSAAMFSALGGGVECTPLNATGCIEFAQHLIDYARSNFTEQLNVYEPDGTTINLAKYKQGLLLENAFKQLVPIQACPCVPHQAPITDEIRQVRKEINQWIDLYYAKKGALDNFVSLQETPLFKVGSTTEGNVCNKEVQFTSNNLQRTIKQLTLELNTDHDLLFAKSGEYVPINCYQYSSKCTEIGNYLLTRLNILNDNSSCLYTNNFKYLYKATNEHPNANNGNGAESILFPELTSGLNPIDCYVSPQGNSTLVSKVNELHATANLIVANLEFVDHSSSFNFPLNLGNALIYLSLADNGTWAGYPYRKYSCDTSENCLHIQKDPEGLLENMLNGYSLYQIDNPLYGQMLDCSYNSTADL